MKFAVFFGVMAVALVSGTPSEASGLVHLGAGWSVISCLLFAAAYARQRPDLLGKRLDGSIAQGPRLLALPVRLLLAAVLWLEGRLTREPWWNQVVPGVYLGRRVGPGDLPPGTEYVVDLTAEFPAGAGRMPDLGYAALPTLDGLPPPPAAFEAMVRGLADERRTLYVHCAQGHGRSALLVTALLLARGVAEAPEDALALVRRARPAIGLSAHQRHLLDRWWETASGPTATGGGQVTDSA